MASADRIRRYKNSYVWHKGIEIAEEIYKITERFPDEERHGMVPHMRRTSISIPSNIAEGFARGTVRERRQFLYESLGDCSELTTQLTVSYRIGYINLSTLNRLETHLEHISKMLSALIRRVR